MKTKMKVLLLLVMMAIGITFTSCDSDDPSNAAVIDMKMKAKTSANNVAGRSAVENVTFNEVLLGVSELELETIQEDELEELEGEDEEEEVEFEGRFVVDLLNGTSTPDFGVSSIVPGVYDEIELELSPIVEDQYSVFVSFSYMDANNETINVEYSNANELEFEIEDDNGFVLEAGVTHQMLVVLDLDLLFSSIDLSNASVDNDGVIRINAQSNAAIASQIDNALYEVFEAGEDTDDDGDLEDED